MQLSSKVQEYDIWLMYLRFADKIETGKVRPVLIVEIEGTVLYVAKITSGDPQEKYNDVQIEEWELSGLHKPSSVRCESLFKVTSEDLLRDTPIGSLSLLDRNKVLEELISLGFLSSE